MPTSTMETVGVFLFISIFVDNEQKCSFFIWKKDDREENHIEMNYLYHTLRL